MNVLAIGAHPDDIEFGCGGTLLDLKSKGHKIYMMIMTNGECGGVDPDIRIKEQMNVAEFLGVEDLIWGGYKDTMIPTNNDVITLIDETIKKTNSELIMFNHVQDTHQDHRALAKCAISASRYMKWVLSFEVPTSISFEPSFFVDIGEVMDRKLELLKLHSSQIDKMRVPHLQITETALACAYFRGFQGKVKFAEGFFPVRYLMNW
ncbi:MAG TPA: PIG-L family deacetylase [bacterium]|nr:PIG-L family deacetylase [bacterium]